MNGPRSHPNPLLRGRRFGNGAPTPKLWYRLARRIFQVTMCAMWRVRVFNRHLEPASGGALYICNHQSYLDPMLMSFALRRPMSYMARASLFRMPGFRHVIESLNALPVKRGAADTAALKEATRRLKAGGQLVVFAEGTRTTDGRIGPFLPGVAMLARRAAEWTVPVVIDGAFEAWPRWRRLPRTGSVVVQYGTPVPRDRARETKGERFVEDLRKTLIRMQTEVRRRIGKLPLDYDRPFETEGTP